MRPSIHFASLIVRARPEAARSVAARIGEEPGVEIHAVETGKIIVVLEASSEAALADRMDAIRETPDVLLVNLVYHHVEPA